ncbi:MAG TPA: S8 family peptidase, partial [Allosphingosinicella sp.]|nr:S8 family peptidase [Allosphingosinicella sp.]
EYARSSGANAHSAISAYNAGGTGRGIKIAVVDSGINPELPEFAGKIDPASRDVAASRGIVDNEGHGTAVSATAAAARNGSGMMGVAFDSTIISLNTSNPNNCTEEKGCKHSDSAIAQAIDIARQNGAKVINISLGGDGTSSAVLNAVYRATSAGIVIVMSAGNEGREEKGSNPGGFALQSAQHGNGALIIAGAVDASRQITDFSNKAGTGAQHYLMALGSRVVAPNQHGTLYYWNGTSFSAPVISGAAALLASAFPNLTGQQIVRLLLTTADDAGDPGRDAVYGNGILNITRAFQPQGQTTMAGSSAPVSTTGNGQGSGTMGDATPMVGGAIILDGYSRAYAVDLAATLSRAAQEQPLAQAIGGGEYRTAGASVGATSVSITMKRNPRAQTEVGLAPTSLTYEDSRKAHAVAGVALSRLTPQTAVAFGFSESGRALQQRLAGLGGNAFLVARDPMSRAGFHADASTSIGVRQDLGPVALTVTSERGEVRNPGLRQHLGRPGYNIGAVTADRSIGPASLSLGASRLQEEATVLGGRFSEAFSSGGSTSYFLDSGVNLDLGGGWGAYASYRRGWTSIQGTGALVSDGRLSTDAFAFDLSKLGAFASRDKLAFRVMQPLRVRSGGFDLNVPVSYDYATGGVGYQQRFFNLAPTGREIDYELAYSVGALGGNLGVNAFFRTDPGHIEAMKNDVGGAIRFTLGF